MLNLACCLLGLSLIVSGPDDRLERFEFVERQMGVSFTIALYAPDAPTANAAAAAAFARIADLNAIMSDYELESELNRLNRTAGGAEPVKLSPELLLVLQHAQRLAERTEGAFDVTVGPLVKEWRRARRRGKLPEADDLEQARSAVGYRHLHLDESAGTVRLARPGMLLDLGAIAKGYAIDEALRALREHGVTRALVDGSGDIAVGEPPPGKSGWRIAVAALDDPERAGTRTLELAGRAVATSGDAFQFVEVDGVRYSHLVDPRTGIGLTTHSSVTVLAPDGITADSLASAVSVLGPLEGLKLVEAIEGVEAFIVEQSADGTLRTHASSGFPGCGAP